MHSSALQVIESLFTAGIKDSRPVCCLTRYGFVQMAVCSVTSFLGSRQLRTCVCLGVARLGRYKGRSRCAAACRSSSSVPKNPSLF